MASAQMSQTQVCETHTPFAACAQCEEFWTQAAYVDCTQILLLLIALTSEFVLELQNAPCEGEDFSSGEGSFEFTPPLRILQKVTHPVLEH